LLTCRQDRGIADRAVASESSYNERRTILRQFDVQVTLLKRDHDPRFTIDWAFDLGDDWWQTELGEEDFSWVEWTRESMIPPTTDIAYKSSA
jgi:hypothetical protein